MKPLPLDPDLGSSPALDPSGSSRFVGRLPAARRCRSKRQPVSVLAVSAGGVVGGCARYGVDELVETPDAGFPWSTFVVNVSGAFVLAVLLVLVFQVWPPTHYVQPFLAVGVVGSFTTFSTWMVEVDQLFVDGARAIAVTYLVASAFAGLAASGAGLLIGRLAISDDAKLIESTGRDPRDGTR